MNDAPGTESQSAHEFSASIAVARNGPAGEQNNQNKDIQRPCFPS
uniref:Small, acid-soluble spore protein gamma-type n=1 Tax=Mesocestoides corti TaxID=53468 RepID=A0A5K3EZL4_MESCO